MELNIFVNYKHTVSVSSDPDQLLRKMVQGWKAIIGGVTLGGINGGVDDFGIKDGGGMGGRVGDFIAEK
jgi:hypothetical protein